MPSQPQRISKSKLLLAEGMDCDYFFRHACEAYDRTDIEVLNYGGIKELKNFLALLKNLEGFDDVDTIVVVRDAEADAASPKDAFLIIDGSPRIGFIILPGFTVDNNKARTYLNGALEDLCLETVLTDALMPCVDAYLACVLEIRNPIRRIHKAKLHAYLAATAGHAGKRLSEAAKDGAFNWKHAALLPIKQIIEQM
jgi:hypothetical protein